MPDKKNKTKSSKQTQQMENDLPQQPGQPINQPTDQDDMNLPEQQARKGERPTGGSNQTTYGESGGSTSGYRHPPEQGD